MNNERNSNFYMANLGSEMLRTFGWYEKSNFEQMNNSKERCLGIIDKILTISISDGQKKEVLILKDILDNLSKDNYHISVKNISSYFYPFSLRLLSASAFKKS